jgi:hypothetical protein
MDPDPDGLNHNNSSLWRQSSITEWHKRSGPVDQDDPEAGVDRKFTLGELHRKELQYLAKRRFLTDGENILDGEEGLSVAVSGGGLRAGSYGLGLMQSLQELGLLHSVEYWSTVSGGGYTSTGFLSHVVQQSGRGSPAPSTVEQQEAILATGVDQLVEQLQEGTATNCMGSECTRMKTAPYVG